MMKKGGARKEIIEFVNTDNEAQCCVFDVSGQVPRLAPINPNLQEIKIWK
jgi:hypothetical protein